MKFPGSAAHTDAIRTAMEKADRAINGLGWCWDVLSRRYVVVFSQKDLCGRGADYQVSTTLTHPRGVHGPRGVATVVKGQYRLSTAIKEAESRLFIRLRNLPTLRATRTIVDRPPAENRSTDALYT